MLLHQSPPSSALNEWIHSFRRYAFQPGDSPRIPCLPGTGAELWLVEDGVLTLHGHRLGDGLICPRTSVQEFRQSALRVFAIRFRAGALPAFIRCPVDSLNDAYTPPGQLWGHATLALVDAVRDTPDLDEKTRLAERMLQIHLRTNRPLTVLHRLATDIFEHSDQFVLSERSAALRRDRRRLSRQFHDLQGIGTKYYHRLCRFERFLRDALFVDRPILAQLAIDHGYCDQSHMQNEVRAITRRSPRALLADDDLRLFYSPRHKAGHQAGGAATSGA